MGNTLSLFDTSGGAEFLGRMSLLRSAAISLGVNLAAGAVACGLQSEKFYDLTGSLTFVTLVLHAATSTSHDYSTRQKVQTGMVLAWAGRIGSYLFSRIMKDGKDRRFDKVRSRPAVFMIYWALQAVWVFLTLWPSLILWYKHESNGSVKAGTTWKDYAGWGLWLVGFLVEALADYQKNKFRADPANHDKFITTGLWSISRHPNYFGEILMWLALFLPASQSFTSKWEYLSLLGPLFDAFLITRVSGVPLLEKRANHKWGADPAYQNYVARTACLIPWIW